MWRIFSPLCWIVVLAASLLTETAQAEPGIAVYLRTLDKTTGHTRNWRVPVGETLIYERLQILVRHCDRTPPTEPPESSVFLEITEQDPALGETPRFSGWMFQSSPALNPLEHAIYDVWVLECVLPTPPAPP